VRSKIFTRTLLPKVPVLVWACYVQRHCRAKQSDIWFETKEAQGTTFFVVLPMVPIKLLLFFFCCLKTLPIHSAQTA